VKLRSTLRPGSPFPSSTSRRRGPSTSGAIAGIAIGAIIVLLGACVPAPPDDVGVTAGAATRPATRTASPVPVASGPTPRPSFSRPTPTAFPTFATYQVAPGDTLTSIARRFDTTPQTIAYWNQVRYPTLDAEGPRYAPNDIRVGWDLVIVPGVDIAEEEDLPSPPPASAGP